MTSNPGLFIHFLRASVHAEVSTNDDDAGEGAGAELDSGSGAAAVTVSEHCDLMLEPWVVEALKEGLRKKVNLLTRQ